MSEYLRERNTRNIAIRQLTDEKTPLGAFGNQMWQRALLKYDLPATKTQLSPPNGSIEGMKTRANTLAKYFFHGFGATSTHMVSGCFAFFEPLFKIPEDKTKDAILADIQLLEKTYSKIKFDELKGDPIYHCLFLGKEILEELGKSVREFLTSLNQDCAGKLMVQHIALNYAGHILRANINRLLISINKVEEFRVMLIDEESKPIGLVKRI